MIIVSQDKKKIINFDNILYLHITGKNEVEKFELTVETDGSTIFLGEYKTEERAKEVLQKLIQSYREYRTAEVDGYTNVLEETAVFEMPEE